MICQNLFGSHPRSRNSICFTRTDFENDVINQKNATNQQRLGGIKKSSRCSGYSRTWQKKWKAAWFKKTPHHWKEDIFFPILVSGSRLSPVALWAAQVEHIYGRVWRSWGVWPKNTLLKNTLLYEGGIHNWSQRNRVFPTHRNSFLVSRYKIHTEPLCCVFDWLQTSDHSWAIDRYCTHRMMK